MSKQAPRHCVQLHHFPMSFFSLENDFKNCTWWQKLKRCVGGSESDRQYRRRHRRCRQRRCRRDCRPQRSRFFIR